MKKIIATIIISLALLATAVTSFWFMIGTNLQLSGVRDRIEKVKLLINNNEPENLKNKEEVLANESKKYFIITSASATLFAVVVATSLIIYENKNEKE